MRSKTALGLVAFLSLKELARKFGLGDFDIKVFRMEPKAGGKSDNFAITTDDSGSWNYQAC